MTQDAGSSFANATRIRFRNTRFKLQDSLSVTDTTDFYQFDLTQSRTFEVALNQLEGNSKLTLYDRNRDVIATSNEQDGDAEAIQRRLEEGQYFLEVAQVEGAFDYQLTAAATTSTAAINRQGSSFERAIEVEQNGSETNLQGQISYSGEVSRASRLERFEYYKFTLVDRTSFSSTLKRLQADCDFTLYNSERQVLLASDRRSSRSESISQVLEAGVYYLRIKAKRSETSYKLDLGFEAVQINGNSIETAETLSVSATEQTITNVIGASDTNDFYRVDLASAGSLKFSLSQFSSETTLEIINSSGTVVASSASISQEQLEVSLTSGTYYLRVTSTSQTIREYQFTYRYEVSRTFTELIQTATVIETGTTTTNTVAPDSEDLYSVTLDKASRLDLKLDGLSADADLQLLDADGNVIDSSRKAGTEPDLVLNNLNPGTYYVRVFLADGAASTSYNLSYNLYDLPLYALSDDNQLVTLDPSLDEPGKDLAFVNITGLAEGETIEAIDFRPGTEELFGISTDDQLYQINLTTGAATPVGEEDLDLVGTFGFDFNPSRNELQVSSQFGSDFIDPLTGVVLDSDGLFTYAPGDVNAGEDSTIAAIAYSNNVAGATVTTLYGIDTNLDVLVRQNLDGELVTVGRLGVDVDVRTGFDIITDANRNDTAYAVNDGTVYRINLVTGAATSLSDVVARDDSTPYNLIGVAVQPV